MQLLVDARDWEYDPSQPPVAYAAEELLTAPDLGASYYLFFSVFLSFSYQLP